MPSPTHPLGVADYRNLVAARLLTVLAQNALVIVLGWAVYNEARATMGVQAASLRLGLIGLVQFLPFLLLTPITGVVADRFDRRYVVRCSLTAQFALAGLLALAAWTHTGSLVLLYAVAALSAAARAFYMPAASSLVPLLVPRELLPRAIAMNAIAGRIGGITGPMLGGYAFAISGLAAYAAISALFAASAFFQFRIRTPLRSQARVAGSPLVLLMEGLVYVKGNRLLLGAISLDLFAVLLGGVTALLPVFARDVLHIGAAGLGELRAASSVGALVTALVMSWRPIKRQVGVIMLASVGVYGLATVGFGLSRSIWLSFACLVLLGAADMVSVFVRQSLIQIATPDDKRGRVGAISSLFVSASNELGEFESGLMAAAMGPVGAVLFGGVASVLVAVGWARLFPELPRARTFQEADD